MIPHYHAFVVFCKRFLKWPISSLAASASQKLFETDAATGHHPPMPSLVKPSLTRNSRIPPGFAELPFFRLSYEN
jgi:hypothetical protein